MKKKLVVLATLFSLLFTFSAVASAAEEETAPTPAPKTYGEALFELGLIQGSDKGLNESGYLNRAEMITILNRLDTRESSDFIAPTVATFSDVPTTHWAFNEVEKAYANGLTTGLGNGKFGVGNKVTYQQAVTFLTRIAGYEVDYNNALLEGEEIGIFLYQDKAAAAELYRADVFELMAETLTSLVKDSEEMLIDKLITDEAKYNAYLDDYLAAYNPMQQAFTYTYPEAYTGKDEHLKKASDKEQAIAAELNKIVKNYIGLSESVDYNTFFNLVQKDNAIAFNFSWGTYVSAEEGGEEAYGVWGGTGVTINAQGELTAAVEATEGNADYSAKSPLVEKYGTATIDGHKVDLYYMEMTTDFYEDIIHLFFLVDSKGIYKAISSGDGYGDGIYTRE